MGQKKVPAKKSDEEKAAEKKLKANESMLKACKDDELKKVEEAVGKGADIDWQNDKGHTAAHVAAAFGALNTIRYLHKAGADLEKINEKKMTPLMAAKHIGETDAAALIEALLAGLSGEGIGKNDDDDDEDDAELLKAKAAAAASSSTSAAADAKTEAYPAGEPAAAAALDVSDAADKAPAKQPAADEAPTDAVAALAVSG